MVNLIGSTPAAEDVLAIPGAHLHLYGKEPRPGRKLGHVTLVEPTTRASRERELRGRVGAALSALCRRAPLMARPQDGQDPPPPLQLERVLLQAGEGHRPADRHGEGCEGDDLRVKRHRKTSF